MAKKVIGYALTPISPSGGGMVLPCILSCMVTQKMLSSNGGGGRAISPEVMYLLENDPEVQVYLADKARGVDLDG